ncbi:MAG: glutamine-hydrolyzing carbamoyl-phosphate synthase small subunit [Spirochaetales bacterium]|nr:glutamine-hydrolyzing carbamoyl-phosphate synthase small subunit [Spirochaetales bacterium]
MNIPCFLVLADGMVFSGRSFGADPVSVKELKNRPADIFYAGEVVFNTGMCGYHEILTDPSYTGQIVMMTYPHIGNYGVDDRWSEVATYPDDRSETVQVSGFIVRELYRGSVPAGRHTLDIYLRENNVCGISGIDTRALTIRLRDNGSINGIIIQTGSEELAEMDKKTVLEFLVGVPSMEGMDLTPYVGTDSKITHQNKKAAFRVALLDCGTKANIVRMLEQRGCEVTIFPSETKAEEVLGMKPDGILASNGPGDPGVLDVFVGELRKMIGKVPMFGICLGHQTIGLALGAKTKKMKFGHHGVNHPVRDEFSRRVIVTSQNHGFMVDEKTLPKDVDVWFRNANDQTLEGFKSKSRMLMTTQFHPEACPGPVDSGWIFDEFISLMDEHKE